ncbi:MAG: YncE family protein [Acidimicrobiia bacterium]|nr:YncE family protein [Acidimicrobiia bacterium]
MFRLFLLGAFMAAGLAAEQQVLLVLLKGANALGFYTLEGKLVEKVEVGAHPHEMALSTDGRYAYITDNGMMRIEQKGKGGNSVSVVDLHARKRIAKISTDQFYRPHGISLDPVTGVLAVTAENPDRLLLVDPERKKLIRNFETKGKVTHMVSFGPGKSGAEWAFVSNSGENTVSAIQLTTGMVKKIPTGERPEGSVLNFDGTILFVTNRESHTISLIDTERHAVINEIKTSKGPVRIDLTPDGRTLVYAAMHDRVIEFIDTSTRQVVAKIPVHGQPISCTVSSDGKYAFASAEEEDTVYVISVPDRKLIREFKTEKGWGPDPVMLATLP